MIKKLSKRNWHKGYQSYIVNIRKSISNGTSNKSDNACFNEMGSVLHVEYVNVHR